MSVRLGALLVAATAAVACGGDAGSDDTAAEGGVSGSVVVFAARSLTDVFGELERRFEAAHPAADVVVDLEGSSALAARIQEAGGADVFASADEANMAKVVASGDVEGEPETFARNRLQIVVPRGNPGRVTGLVSFGDSSLLIGLCAQQVPCGRVARELLTRARVEPAVDTNEPDVRSLLAKVAAGELDAGLVYETDVRAAGDSVESLPTPGAAAVLATYVIAPLDDAANLRGARAFVDLVLSDEGRRVLTAHGFLAP
jgi:molybdate transport system substrate-binding protein